MGGKGTGFWSASELLDDANVSVVEASSVAGGDFDGITLAGLGGGMGFTEWLSF